MRRAVLCILFAMTALLSSASAQQAPVAVGSVAAEGTQFRLTLSDGRVLRPPELAGAALIVATPDGQRKTRLTTVERDPDAKSDDVWLHTMMVEQPDGTLENMCSPRPDGRKQGFPIATRTRADGGSENTVAEQFDLVCTAGARAKCIRFGYRYWVPAEEPLYNACTRMVRGDYCGGGDGTTRDGMLIDMYDDLGIQKPDDTQFDWFEAGWAPGGAVCVRQVRVKENTSLETLAASCPRLAGKLGAMCTEESARAMGAKLFNRSKP